MNRRDRDRYDHDNYDNFNSGAGYDRNDEHYHSARNLTNEFEQEYRRHHPEMDRERYERSNMRQRYNEGNLSDRYDHNRGRHLSDYDSYSNSNRSDNRDHGQHWSASDRYNTTNRYSQHSGDFDRNRDMRQSNWSDNRGRFSNQDRSSRMQNSGRGYMSEDRMREGYGISDYGRMRSSEDIHSSRGIPNAGITSSFEDDFGSDLDSNRSHRQSSGNYGGYGSRGGYSQDRDDRY